MADFNGTIQKKKEQKRLFDVRLLRGVEEGRWEWLQVVEMPRARSPPAQTRGLNVLDGNNWPTTRKWRISISVLLTSVEPGAKEPLGSLSADCTALI